MNSIHEIFYGKELTIENSGTCILNKWTGYSIVINKDIIDYLIKQEFLIEDSGNWETGDIHFIYNRELVKVISSDNPIWEKLKPVLREIRLNKIFG